MLAVIVHISRAPSLHRYSLLAGLLIAFVGLVTFIAPTDPDAWWHLRNGQLVLQEGVPTQDVYSFTAEERPWLMQEWLTEVVMYQLKSTFGYWALSLLFGLLQALGGLLVYLLLRQHGAGRITALVLLMLYFTLATPTWGVRPQVLTPVFLGTFYLVLGSYREEPSRVRFLYVLPILMALWANMHASYFMGIALMGAFLVGEAATNYLYRPERPMPIKPLFLTLAACVLATLVNPYFVELWGYPLSYIINGTSNPLLRYTQEWQSPDFHQPGNMLFGLSLVALVLLGIGRAATEQDRQKWRIKLHRRLNITDAIITAAFIMLALQAVRLVPLYGVMVLPLLAGAIARLLPGLSRQAEVAPSARESRLNWGGAITGTIAIALLVLTRPQAQTFSEPRADTGYVYPEAAVAYLSKKAEPVRMYNNFAWGGYLIYKLYPRQKVFIDGRADMYREGIFEDFIAVQDLEPHWRDVLERYDVNLSLITPGSPLDKALSIEPGWRLGYKDDVAVIYERDN